MARIIKLKNIQDALDTYCGQEIAAGAYYQLEATEFTRFANDQKVQLHLADNKALINDGTADLAYLPGKLHLEGNGPSDSNGVPIYRQYLVNTDNRPIIHSTPRKIGTYTYFSSRSDSPDNPSDIGGGTEYVEYVHTIDDPAEASVYFDVNAIVNETYIQGAFWQWSGCVRDSVEFEIGSRSSADAITTGTNTNYEVMYGVLVMVPGTGTKSVPDWDLIYPVEMVPNEFGVIPPGYWDADYNTTTEKFENYTFRADGSGRFNIFAEEVEFNCFIPCFLMLGDREYDCHPSDCSQVGHNMRFKILWKTRGTDHNWQFCASIKLYRKHTV